VLEALRAKRRRARRLYLQRGSKGLDESRRAAGTLPCEEAGRTDLDRLSGGVLHQGVVLEADPLPVLSPEAWLDRNPGPDAMVVMLDEIEDPQNFGAIVRTAAACGAAAVVFGKHRSAPLSPAAVKSAAGAMEYIDLVQATNLVRALGQLKDAGFWAAGLDGHGPTALWDAKLTGRIVLIVGSEGRGLRRLTRDHCDLLVRIPVAGPITTLNASVSAAIALAECCRQRQ